MTAIPGTRRLLPSADTLQAAMWAWMRRKRAPWTCAELAEAVGASERQARRYASRLAAAGYLAEAGGRGGEAGRIPALLWSLADNTGPLAPVLVGGAAGEGVEEMNSEMSGAELRAIRRAMGLSARDFGHLVLGVADQRTVRRYEQSAIVPAPAAARAQEYLARG